MALLPSGTQFCIDSLPLDRLLHLVNNASGLHLPDLLTIQTPNDLRHHLRLLWLLPLGADCSQQSHFHSLSPPIQEGLTLIDSGYRLDQEPAHLDERDRHALSLFWESARCQAYAAELMAKVQNVQNSLRSSSSPEDHFLNLWFPQGPLQKPTRPEISPAESIENTHQTTAIANP
jgi:hypothetical protein